jgi:adenylosuccinate synthase
MPAKVLIGLQWGDEGKAKALDALTEENDIVIRYQGGANAGHTTVTEEFGKVIFHLVPSGILHHDKECVITNGVLTDPGQLLSEIKELNGMGVSFDGRLKLSDRSHIVLPYHKVLDRARDIKQKIGTTGRGMGPGYGDKYGRIGIRAGDLTDPVRLKRKILAKKEDLDELMKLYVGTPELQEELMATLKKHDLDEYYNPDKGFDLGLVVDELRLQAVELVPFIEDTVIYLNTALNEGKRLLFEGAQGALLDVDFGTYPFVTPSNSDATGVCAGSGVAPTRIDSVAGLMKSYTTRVGGGPFPTEDEGEIGERLREKGDEYGATTGRPRRCGWFDAVATRHAARFNHPDSLIITKLDVLTGIDPLKICVAYRLDDQDGEIIEHFPADAEDLAICRPIYEEMPGFKEDIKGAKDINDLPREAVAYVDRIKNYVDPGRKAKLIMISTGPGRQERIDL